MKFIRLLVFIWIIIFLQAFSTDTAFTKNPNAFDKTIKIGLLIQDNKSIEAQFAAELAISKANENGGINGIPVQLVTRSMEGPWGTGSKQAIDLIFNEKVWAILGSHDGRNAHLVEQASAKTRMVFLSAWASDPTLSQAFVPWYFSCVPNDRQQANALIEEIYNKRKFTKIALVSDNGYDSKLSLETFIKATIKMNKQLPSKFIYEYLSNDFKEIIKQIEKANVDGIVLFGQPSASAKIIEQLRQKKMEQPVFGSLALLGETGSSDSDMKKYENVILIAPGNNKNSNKLNFYKEFQKRTGKNPGAVAFYAFDGMNSLIEAIKKSGTDRNMIKNSLSKLQHNGITGTIQFDDKGNRIGRIYLMEIKNGIPVMVQR